MMSEISVLSDVHDKASLVYSQDFLAEINILESQFNDRYNNVVTIYEERINNLSAAVQQFLTDEIVTEMRNDPTSSSFVKAYLERSVDHHFATEREQFISNILRKLSIAESEVYKLKHINANLRRNFSNLLEKDKSFVSSTDERFNPAMKKIEELSRRYIDYCEDSDKEILDLRAKLHQNREESNQLREELQHVLVQLSDKCSECDSLSRTLQDSRDYMAAIERIKTQLRSTVSLQQSHHQQEERDSLLATFEQQLQHLTEDQEQLHSDCG
jgi:uncharacterized phage infection (PIP) family protein YhgE